MWLSCKFHNSKRSRLFAIALFAAKFPFFSLENLICLLISFSVCGGVGWGVGGGLHVAC